MTLFLAMENQETLAMIKEMLGQFEEIEVTTYTDPKEMLGDLYKNPHIVIFSISFSDYSGSVIMKKIKKADQDITMTFVTPERLADQVGQLMNLGAYSYINRDKDTEERILNVLRNTIEWHHQKLELRRMRAELGKKYKFSRLLRGNSTWLHELYNIIERAAHTGIPVSLYGEKGTGKKLIAKTIHFHSSFAGNPFIEIDPAVVPEYLIEAELFGTERTFSSGEKEIFRGKIEEAQRSTLFIRNVEKLPAYIQDKLSNVIEEKIFYRVGSENPLRFSSRLIVSSEKSLLDCVHKGIFSESLYYKLTGIPVRIAPLRERDSDILYLARMFLNRFCRDHEIKKLHMTEAAQQKLVNYPYPGNVAELKAVVELAATLAFNRDIDVGDVHFFRTDPMLEILSKEQTLNEYTHHIIKCYLDRYDDDIIAVSEKLDIGKSTIYRLKKLGEI